MSKIRHSVSIAHVPPSQERCSCAPPGSLAVMERAVSEGQEESEERIPIAPVLYRLLQAALASYYPRSTPFSLILLHVTQFEHIQMPPDSPIVHRRVSCHAPASFLDQVLHPIHRTLRGSDLVLADEGGSGAAFLFPQVDRVGIACIAERISRSINLLQAETVVPPLRQQTEIVLGVGSYSDTCTTQEALVVQASGVRERIVFHPAVLPDAAPARASAVRGTAVARRRSVRKEVQLSGVPFMQIPSRLPARLKQLVPYALALELRCAPVGRDHNRLTVAMANPGDARAIYHLREVTGMTIFPVSCEVSALEVLLASDW